MATVTKRTWTTGKGEKREAWVLAYTDKKGDRHKEQFAKKREADAERVKVEGQISKGAFRADAASKTVKNAIDAYVKHLEKRHGKGEHVTTMYLRNTSGQFRTHVEPEIGGTKLSELTTRLINEMVDKLKDADVGLPTIRRVVGALSRALAFAVGQDWVATNAAKGVRVIGKRGQGSEKVVPPSKKALADILEKGDADMKRRIQFSAATGLRASEQWAVRWRHVDLEARTVKVEERVDPFGEFDTTKSESGQRTVPLGKTIVSMLRGWKAETSHNSADDFVFPDTEGGFTRHTNFLRRHWKPLIEAAEVKGIGWHALRHFAVSTWIEAGLQPKAVQTLAGHASYAITMDRYGHLFPSDDHVAAMDKIAKALFSK